MLTLRQFSTGKVHLPGSTGWLLADLGEAIGKQALFTAQSPHRLKTLRENALVESAVSSNRIEGVEVDEKRIGTLVFGKSASRDRDEEEVRGYRSALNLIHSKRDQLAVSESTVRRLHRMIRGEIWDAGKYKDKDGDIIDRLVSGGTRVRFKPTSAKQTPAAMKDLLSAWHECEKERWVHPLVALAAFNLDFLCIHPFRDGNGRTSRLLLVQQCYHASVEVGRYVSLERLIEQNKDRYYETLELSSKGWHEGKHDPFTYINFLLFTLKEAFKELEVRVGSAGEEKGSKEALVHREIAKQRGEFKLIDIERACPTVGRDWIRVILRELKKTGKVSSSGRGPAARWRWLGK